MSASLKGSDMDSFPPLGLADVSGHHPDEEKQHAEPVHRLEEECLSE